MLFQNKHKEGLINKCLMKLFAWVMKYIYGQCAINTALVIARHEPSEIYLQLECVLKAICMVSSIFNCRNQMWKVNRWTSHESGTKKYPSPWQASLTHDLLNAGGTLYPLSYESELMESKVSSYVTGIQHTARINTVEVIVCVICE